MPAAASSLSMRIRPTGNEECPHCPAILNPTEYLRVDCERLRCAKCREDFIPLRKGDGPLMGTELESAAPRNKID